MALNYITLILDLADGTGTPRATGQAGSLGGRRTKRHPGP
jgi:hypothetical protein